MKQTMLVFVMLFSCVSLLSAQDEEPGAGQFMFSVKPELLGLAGGSFGYKLPSDLVLFGGIDYFHLGTTIDVSTTYLNIVGPGIPSSSSSETEASLNVYNLYVAAKLFVVKKNAIKGYLLAEVSKPIIKGSLEVNGKSDPGVESISDNLDVWGLKGAFGTEYFFSDNFSLGGEFGLRVLLLSSTDSKDTPYYSFYYDPNTGQYVTVQGTRRQETKVSFNFSLTYSTLTLNYYF